MKNNYLLHFGLFVGRLSLPMGETKELRVLESKKHDYSKKRSATFSSSWLRVLVVLLLFAGITTKGYSAVVTNYVRVEETNNSSNGKAFVTWEEAMAYLKDQPVLSDGETYTIKVLNKSKGLTMGDEMPDKPCIITSSTKTKYTLTIPDNVNLKTDLTFDNVYLANTNGYSSIYAGGHKLTFTKNVSVSFSGLSVYGGTSASRAPVETTSLVLNGGSFSEVYGGCQYSDVTCLSSIQIGGSVSVDQMYGGCFQGNVSSGTSKKALARITIGEGAKLTVSGSLVGGCLFYTSKCDQTEVLITDNASVSGNIYAGSAYGETGKTLLKITGTPTIQADTRLYGGGFYDTIGNTNVIVEGGTFNTVSGGKFDAAIIGGGYASTVTGDTHVTISGGTGIKTVCGGNRIGYDDSPNVSGTVMGTAYITIEGGQINEVYGSGFDQAPETGGVQNVNIQVKGTADNSRMFVYGSGHTQPVRGNIDIAVLGGKMAGVFAMIEYVNVVSPNDYPGNNNIYGNTNITVKGGEITNLGVVYRPNVIYGAAHDGYGQIIGDVDIIIDGKDAKIGNLNAYWNENKEGEEYTVPFKPATLTFKNYGTSERPAIMQKDIELFTEVVADNSIVGMGAHSFIIHDKYPVTLSGKTWQLPENQTFQLKSHKDEAVALNRTLVETGEWNAEDFTYTNENQSETANLYKVGNTIRYDDGTQAFHAVTIEDVAEPEKGSLEVVWDKTVVNSGDKLPEVENMKLTATVTPALGYSGKLFKGEDEQSGLSLETKCDADMTFSAAFTEKNYTVTYEQPEHGTITVQDAGGATIESGGTVAYKTQNTLVVTPAAGYQIGANAPSATYIEDGQTEAQPLQLTPVEGKAGHYSFEMPAGEVTITAEFSSIPPYNPPYVPSYYDLYFEENDSVRLSSNYKTVEEGYSFTITAEVAEGYDQETLVVEYKKGRSGNWRILERESNGVYRVRNVYNDIYVRASVRPGGDPTALDRVKDGTSLIRALDKRIHITVNEPVKMRIVGIGGRVVRTEQLPAGYSEISGLQDGIYIVILSDGTRSKVVIR